MSNKRLRETPMSNGLPSVSTERLIDAGCIERTQVDAGCGMQVTVSSASVGLILTDNHNSSDCLGGGKAIVTYCGYRFDTVSILTGSTHLQDSPTGLKRLVGRGQLHR